MKKATIFAAVFLSFNVLQASEFNTISDANTVIGNPNERVSSGKISETNSNEFKIIDDVTGEMFEVVRHGAQVEFVVGDDVTYRIIGLPNGNPPIVIDVHRPR